jgi:drug/metabolite transporter superfamily protein YnfA
MGVWGLQAPAAGGSFCLSALLLIWPALWNGYPLMFADSGTYVIQVPTLSLGWDRPPFYSLFLLLFHLRLSLWPVVVAQAFAATLLLRLALRAVAPCGSEWRLVGVAGVLAVASSLPWFAAQVMPDLFTGLLVIALALLATRPGWMLAAAATAMITLHLSHLPLAVAVLAGVLAWRWWRDRARPGWAVVLPPVLAAGLLLCTNLIGHGRAAIAPFGGVFLLARLIEDGPARAVLARDCDHAGWALCRDRADLPPTADAVLWSPTSPLQAVERAARDQRRVADEADAIVARTWRTEAPAVLAGAGRATLRQLAAFGTGDGLHPWPEAVTPKLARVLPEADLAGYAQSRQTLGTLAVPAWLRALHVAAALAGVALCPLLLLLPGVPEAARVLALATLIALPVNAAVTGALSGPHDRYQSRVMWLPLAVAACALPGLWRARRPAAMACA